MAKIQKSQFRNSNIEVIETFRLSNTKYIQIVKLGGKYVAIAVGKDTVNFLTELEEEELDLTKPENKTTNLEFQEILKKVKDMNRKK